MNTCDTCKWWGAEPNSESPDTRDCNHPKIGYFAEGVDSLVAHDAEGYGYSGYVTTGPKFGCIHHEPAPEFMSTWPPYTDRTSHQ